MPAPDTDLGRYAAVVITGGSSGIGKSFIRLLSTIGPNLVFFNLSRRSPDDFNGKLKLRHVPCDLSDPGQVERASAEVLEGLAREAPTGPILLINNSGFGAYGTFAQIPAPEQLGMIDVNVRAVVQLTAAFIPVIKSRGGVIVNVASVAGFMPTPYLSTYGATKAFVLHWSLALNEELRGSGARALALCPGPTSTDFFKRAGLAEGSVPDALGQTSDDVVRATLRAIRGGRSLVVSGWKNKLIAAFTSLVPKSLMARLSGIALAIYRNKRTAA
jgi:short-subunit dehydrogenase